MKNELIKRIVSSIVLLPIVLFLIIKGSYFFLILLMISFIIAIYEWHIMSKNKSYNILGFVFIICSFSSIYKIRMSDENSLVIFFIILLICILTDIGGYVFGKSFKGPKLISYSPNKTYAGLIGAYLLSFILIPVLIYYDFISIDEALYMFIFIFIISSVSQVGDIIVSFFKRKSNIKDTGKLIPGHGGILDRIDGILFAFPFAYIIMSTNLIDFIL